MLAHPEPDHDSIGIEDECKWRLLADQAKPEYVSIEALRAFYVDDGYKSYDVVVAQAGIFRHGAMMKYSAG